ncbi:ADP-ribosyl-[dinitrogen reductase] hydrolase [Rhodobacter sp. JA431]|uniref:ADP-ribosyl-[dinitrogen reductase] hydrolase n=1 Tax=Rhodobacter sp. JA431 TaxID=570013 RepID=UPI000BC5C2EB|nr:ADP-ribosyl-[dinitrogen reductase] hydrolase [Rhodobacter sp. JA431]SOC17617.1 ADP-ribosyl-[dinitrogen reductase] hydrolase [Rhodobacter sp. JA431]
MSDCQDRALAAYLGFALGDALGATTEFMTAREIATQLGVHRDITGGGWLRLRPGAVTDDTQMSLALGRSLIRCGGLEARDLCEEFSAWLATKPADVGNTCRRGIKRFQRDGSVAGPEMEDDAGNGAAMRVLPVALATLGVPDRAEEWAWVQAHTTHNNPLSDAACLALVRMVQGLIIGEGKAAVERAGAVLVEQHRIFRFEPYRGLCSAFVVETMQTVLHHLLAADSFEEAVVATVNQGGDADTTGALVGMLAGALWGLESLPMRWLAVLDTQVQDEITDQVPKLLAL